jgi:collagen type VI alpha
MRASDVVFVLDASGSIWGPDFTRQLEFVTSMVDTFSVGPSAIRVGVETFGNEPQLQFNLDSFSTKEDIRGAISRIQQSRGSTNTAAALASARVEFFGAYGRQGVVRVAIVVTDGQSNDPRETATEARALREAGAHVFAVGVGRNAAREELEVIASEPTSSFVFMVESFKGLEKIGGLLAERTCEGMVHACC